MYETSAPAPYAQQFPPQQPPPRTPPRFLVSDITMGLLVLVLTLVTAWAGYQAELAGDDEGDNQVLGQSKLSEASTLALGAVQALAQDASALDNFILHQDDPELAAYFQGKFSPELTANLNAETGQINQEAYIAAMFKNASTAEEASTKAYDEAEKTGDAVNSYSLVVLVFALGIALAGLGALRRDGTWLRGMFALAALVMLVFGGVVMSGIDYFDLRL